MRLSVSTESQLRRETSAGVNTPKMMAFPHGPTHAVLVLGHQEAQRTMQKHAQPGTESLTGNILELSIGKKMKEGGKITISYQ